MPETCGRCGSDKMMEDVHLYRNPSTAASLVPQGLVAAVRSPHAWFQNVSAFGDLRARICGGCGYTEIYTTNFEKLYEAYQQSRRA